MAIDPIGRGKWKVTIVVGKKANGARDRRSMTIEGSRRKAEQFERQWKLMQRQADDRPDPAAVTVADVVDRYIAENRDSFKPSTLEGYTSKLESIIRPAFGDQLVAALDNAEIEAHYRALQRGQRVGALTPRIKLSARSVLHAHRLMASAFKDAKRTKFIPENPFVDVEPPKVGKLHVGRIDPAEVSAIFHAAREVGDHDLEEVAQLALATGARLGELCGLRWQDVTLTTGVVCFSGVSTRKDGETIRLPRLKTDGPPKVMRVDEACRAMLERRFARQVEECAGLGLAMSYLDDVAVCSRMLEQDATSTAAVSARWSRAAKRAPSTFRFHDLRHLACSAMMAGGMSAVETAARAGHANPTMTLNVYGHTFGSEDERAVTILGAVWDTITGT